MDRFWQSFLSYELKLSSMRKFKWIIENEFHWKWIFEIKLIIRWNELLKIIVLSVPRTVFDRAFTWQNAFHKKIEMNYWK